MRDTDELIKQLAGDLQPVSSHAMLHRLSSGVVLGAGISLLVLYLSVGVRSDLPVAIYTWPFWMKWLYVVALAAIGFVGCLRLGRPGAHLGKLLLLFIVPILLLAFYALYQLQYTTDVPVRKLWLGHSALVCPWNIVGFSIPVFFAVVRALKRFAPTQLHLTGFIAGCLSGAAGAVVYALYCNESAAPFVLAWYSLGVFLAGAIGALLGPRVLRW